MTAQTYTIVKPKNRDKWLDERRSSIGSSEIATIIGMNPFQTPYQLWRLKLGIDKPAEENFFMKAGHYLEDAVSHFWEDETGKKVIKSSAGDWLMRDKERKYMTCSPDRTYWLSDNKKDGKGILEIKTTQRKIDENDLPKHWFCQVQWQLGIAGLDNASLAWLTSGRDFGYKYIELDKDFFLFLREQCERFWTDNIIGKKEPDAICVQDVLLRYPKSTIDKSVVADGDIMQACSDIKGLAEKIDELAEQREALESKIKMFIGDAEYLTDTAGNTLCSWKSSKNSTKFDYKRFEKEHPEECNPYIIDTQGSRRFMVR